MNNKFNVLTNEQEQNVGIFTKEDVSNFLNDSSINFGEMQVEQSIEPIDTTNSYNILIVDDEPDIHRMTKLNLNNFSFNNKSLTFFHAYFLLATLS